MDAHVRTGCAGVWLGRSGWPAGTASWLLGCTLICTFGGCVSLGATRSGAERPQSDKRPRGLEQPIDTLAAYRTALERDDPASAYRLLSPTIQQRLTVEKWSARWRETQFERAAQLKLLPGAAPSAQANRQAGAPSP